MNFKNKNIELPKFTIIFEEKIEEIERLNKDLILGKVSRIVVLKKCYEFLAELLTEEKLLEILQGNSFEEIDTKELELFFFYVKLEYEKPLEDAITKREQERINNIFKNTNISEVVKVYEKVNGKK
ncbi:hypothetical protein [[Clostridium] colinum]|uniref:hypothetical protein n=1 Tax=[Clostridium] colinum TaxID=36835 RepID=UPI002024C84A|nr:hypothetical protein [[Clostridium] colinum]